MTTKTVTQLVIITTLVMLGLLQNSCGESSNAPKGSSTPQVNTEKPKETDKGSKTCKEECSKKGPFCLRVPKSAFREYPNDIENLYFLAEQKKSSEKGIFTLGKNGSIKFETKIIFDKTIGGTLKPTYAVTFQKSDTEELKLEILSDTQTPYLTFNDSKYTNGFGGKLNSIDFIGKDPVMDFTNGCLFINGE